jgi:hypothetical protein
MYRHTAPGGYIELVEIQSDVWSDDDTIPPGSAILRYIEHLNRASSMLGLRTPNDMEMHKLVQDAGFDDIEVFALKQPLSPWPKEGHLKKIGEYMLVNAETGFMSYGLAMFTRVLRMTLEEATEICRGAVADSQNTKMHMYGIW